MSLITVGVTCPYCGERTIIEHTEEIRNLVFAAIEGAEYSAVELPSFVTDCLKCDRRFVVSLDLKVEVLEFAILGEAEKPTGDNIKEAVEAVQE